MPESNAPSPAPILVINSGSSSLKAGLFLEQRAADPDTSEVDERPVLLASATGIGQAEGKLSITDGDGRPLADRAHSAAHDYQDQGEALAAVAATLVGHHGAPPAAIGHRIVHGGMHLTEHCLLTPEVLKTLADAVHFAPLHIPGSVELMHRTEKLYPDIPQFACFDTAFHQTMPEIAWRYPVPRRFADDGLRRYGFHGLSYESIVAQLRRETGTAPLPERIVIAHLGSGASLCAVRDGVSIDTTMGLTPTGGIIMATRTGDIDPGVLIYLRRAGQLSTDELEQVLNRQSGLKAISNGMSDMQKLLQAQDEESALAVKMFALSVAKAVASLIVSLGGLDLLVFTGGIGEHSAEMRARIVDQVAWLGLALDPDANAKHSTPLSTPESKALIRTLPAQEDVQIARHCRRMLGRR